MKTFPTLGGPLRSLALLLGLAGASMLLVACPGSKGEEEPIEGDGGTGAAEGQGDPGTEGQADPGAAEKGGDAADPAVDSPTLVFDPERVEHRDVGLGEVRRYTVRASWQGEGERPKVTGVSSSCGCLSGKAVAEDEGGLDIEVTIEGVEPENIDGVISVLGEDRKVLAEHTCVLLVTSRPFVTPRELLVDPKTREVRITLGCGFSKQVQEPELVCDEPVFDESLLMLEDWILDEKLELEYFLKTETFVLTVPEEAFAEDGSTTFEINTLEPEKKSFRVDIRWNASE